MQRISKFQVIYSINSEDGGSMFLWKFLSTNKTAWHHNPIEWHEALRFNSLFHIINKHDQSTNIPSNRTMFYNFMKQTALLSLIMHQYICKTELLTVELYVQKLTKKLKLLWFGLVWFICSSIQ